ncbi:molybdopterin-dependent oxidoreductase [Candidatus Contubernalis alkalaceticus]|nr:molybdopterin dinucleotide binding domain-containing protein [Candidatus Contubernalis alkalaceticus]UNC91498.1 molybdopterin-dependent oxidoreductase [Candidatus Contubernalis alkalaceticus]
MPKLEPGKDHSSVAYYTYMGKGEIKGLLCFADNPVVSGASTAKKRKAQANLDWLVAVDMFENETCAFWKAPDMNAADIDTEVFLLPAAGHFEKEGTATNSGRWIQWRNKAQDAAGDAKPDLWIVDKLFKAVRDLYDAEGGAFPEPILEMNWDYGDEPDVEKVAQEINGYYVADGKLMTGFADFINSEPGDVACGSWIYPGFYADESSPACKSRVKETEGIGANLQYSWAWPMNRRIVYNRASCDADGKPWNPDLPVMEWDGSEWKMNDVPDFNAAVPPEDTASKGFIMTPELQARLFAPGMVDGPFPEHYEPWESVTSNKMSSKEFNPCCKVWYPEDRGSSSEYPYICTTYRLVEHYQTAIMTRNIPWLVEAMPEMFCEISPSLADKIGVENGDMVEIETKRGKIQCKAAVTVRIKPLMINGEEKEIVGMPFHWGFMGLSSGASANDLSPTIGCANTTIPEFKSFICDIRRAG